MNPRHFRSTKIPGFRSNVGAGGGGSDGIPIGKLSTEIKLGDSLPLFQTVLDAPLRPVNNLSKRILSPSIISLSNDNFFLLTSNVAPVTGDKEHLMSS